MISETDKLKDCLVSIASETFRFQRVFEKATAKLDADERAKYMSQFAWFSKKVMQALGEASIRVLNTEGHLYDPGMSVTPLNLDDFNVDDPLYVAQMIEPIIMQGDTAKKTAP